jgi:predicted permease
VDFHEIAPRFFETLKIPLVQGRDFNDGDRPGSPRVMVVNETLATRMWPQVSPLGQSLMVNGEPHQVVGVFRDARLRNALEAPLPFLYLAVWQNTKHTDSRMVVRVASDPQAMLPLLRREIAAVDPKVPITEDMPMTRQVDAVYMPVLLTSSVAVCSGVLALFLSMIGLYGVLSFAVSQRTREIGVRMALGAQQLDVLKLVVGQGISLALIGVALGMVAAFGLTRVMASLLFGVSTTDAVTFFAVAVGLMVVALPACYIPARRATKVDPLVALRYE